MIFMNDNETLIHYGVLGMKWGVRRASNKGTNYQYKSLQQKHLQKKVNKATKRANLIDVGKELNKIDGITPSKRTLKKAEKTKNKYLSKADKAQKKLDNVSKRDKALQKYAEKTSVGKALAQKALFGAGDKTYQTLRSQDVSRGKAALGYLLKSNRKKLK